MYCETFWLQAFGTRNSSLTNAKVYVLLYSLILFNFEFEGNFQVQAHGGLYLEERFKGGFFTLRGWGLIFGGAYTWRGLFSEFYGDATVCPWPPVLFFQISL